MDEARRAQIREAAGDEALRELLEEEQAAKTEPTEQVVLDVPVEDKVEASEPVSDAAEITKREVEDWHQRLDAVSDISRQELKKAEASLNESRFLDVRHILNDQDAQWTAEQQALESTSPEVKSVVKDYLEKLYLEYRNEWNNIDFSLKQAEEEDQKKNHAPVAVTASDAAPAPTATPLEIDQARKAYFEAKKRHDEIHSLKGFFKGRLNKETSGKVDEEFSKAKETYEKSRAEYIGTSVDKFIEEQNRLLEQRYEKIHDRSRFAENAAEIFHKIGNGWGKLATLNLERGLEKFEAGKQVLNFVDKVGTVNVRGHQVKAGRAVLRSLNARTAISYSLLGTGLYFGAGSAVGTAAVVGRRYLSALSAGVGSRNVFDLVFDKAYEKVLSPSYKGPDANYIDISKQLSYLESKGLLAGKSIAEIQNSPEYQEIFNKYEQNLKEHVEDWKNRITPERITQYLNEKLDEIDNQAKADIKARKVLKGVQKASTAALGAVVGEMVRSGEWARLVGHITKHAGHAAEGVGAGHAATAHVTETVHAPEEFGQGQPTLADQGMGGPKRIQLEIESQTTVPVKVAPQPEHLTVEHPPQVAESAPAPKTPPVETHPGAPGVVEHPAPEHPAGSAENVPAEQSPTPENPAAEQVPASKPSVPAAAEQAVETKPQAGGMKPEAEHGAETLRTPEPQHPPIHLETLKEGTLEFKVTSRGIEGSVIDLFKENLKDLPAEQKDKVMKFLYEQGSVAHAQPTQNTLPYLVHRWLGKVADENGWSFKDGSNLDLNKVVSAKIEIDSSGHLALKDVQFAGGHEVAHAAQAVHETVAPEGAVGQHSEQLNPDTPNLLREEDLIQFQGEVPGAGPQAAVEQVGQTANDLTASQAAEAAQAELDARMHAYEEFAKQSGDKLGRMPADMAELDRVVPKGTIHTGGGGGVAHASEAVTGPRASHEMAAGSKSSLEASDVAVKGSKAKVFEQLKKQYVEKYGQQAYEDLIHNGLSSRPSATTLESAQRAAEDTKLLAAKLKAETEWVKNHPVEAPKPTPEEEDAHQPQPETVASSTPETQVLDTAHDLHEKLGVLYQEFMDKHLGLSPESLNEVQNMNLQEFLQRYGTDEKYEGLVDFIEMLQEHKVFGKTVNQGYFAKHDVRRFLLDFGKWFMENQPKK